MLIFLFKLGFRAFSCVGSGGRTNYNPNLAEFLVGSLGFDDTWASARPLELLGPLIGPPSLLSLSPYSVDRADPKTDSVGLQVDEPCIELVCDFV